MINDAKIDFRLIGRKGLENIQREMNPMHNHFKNILNTISKLDQHSERFYVVIHITNKPVVNENTFSATRLKILMDSLTKRELEVYGLALKGFSNRSIAEKLFISVETVKSHRKKIVRKVGVKSIEEIKTLILDANNLIE